MEFAFNRKLQIVLFFCWNVLRPLDLLVGDPGIQSNCNLDWRERACTVYW